MKNASKVLAVTLAALALMVGCGDPTHDDAVTALGKDPNGISDGPTHRAGQPCLVCHGGSGPGSPQFAFAGTVYAVQGRQEPLVGGTVELTDANGLTFATRTNEVGNFYIYASDFSGAAPLHVKVTKDDAEADMATQIGRDGSCAGCHTSTPGPRSPGPVYLTVGDSSRADGGQ